MSLSAVTLTHRDHKRIEIAVAWAQANGYTHLNAWRAEKIIEACIRHSLPRSLGFALIQHESGFRNIFGHDPTRSVPARLMGRAVTKARYLAYRVKRKLGLGMQGVGPGQLTWWQTQDYADSKGGCWRFEVNVDVAIETLAARIREFGYVKGIERYNGSGAAAVLYSKVVRGINDQWHRRFNP